MRISLSYKTGFALSRGADFFQPFPQRLGKGGFDFGSDQAGSVHVLNVDFVFGRKLVSFMRRRSATGATATPSMIEPAPETRSTGTR